MQTESRRGFNQKLLGSITAFGMIELLFENDLFANEVKPVIDRWMKDVYELCKDVKGRKIKDLEWQKKLEELYARVDLKDLIKFVELDKIKKTVKLPDNGATSRRANLSKVEGIPERLPFGNQIFCMKKGRSVVPHGHNNMCTGFIILAGEFHGRHYDRLKDEKDHYLIKPTIDRRFKPGESSTISDHKDNVHWFKATSDTGYVFNVHVLGYNPEQSRTGRAYLDPEGAKNEDGLIIAPKMTSRECHKKYG